MTASLPIGTRGLATAVDLISPGVLGRSRGSTEVKRGRRYAHRLATVEREIRKAILRR
jgi:hypothetical protein